MNARDVRKHPSAVLNQGYYLDEGAGKHKCLWCDFQCDADKPEAAVRHSKNHGKLHRLYVLLQAQSIHQLSVRDQRMLWMLANGCSHKKIAEALKTSTGNVRVIKHRLIALYDYVKVMNEMLEIAFGEADLPGVNEYDEDAVDEITQKKNLVPVLNETRDRVVEFLPKDIVHNPENPKPHATVLVLVIHRDKVLLVNKVETSVGTSEAFIDILSDEWDVFGGHASVLDFAADAHVPIYSSVDIPFDIHARFPVLLRSAMREMDEEMHSKIALNIEENLTYLWTLPYEGETAKGQYNIEISHVYVIRLNDSKVQLKDLVAQEEYVTAFGDFVRKKLPIMPYSYDEFLALDDESMLDGALRIKRHLIAEQITEEQFFALCSAENQ